MKTKNILCEECHGMGFISMVGENSIWSERCNECNGEGNIEVPITNFDKITESVESLAEFIDSLNLIDCNACVGKSICDCHIRDCKEVFIKWLQQETDNV